MAGLTIEPGRASGDDGKGEPPRSAVAPADQRAIRVAVSAGTRLGEEASIVVAPPPEPLRMRPQRFGGRGLLGGAATGTDVFSPSEASPEGPITAEATAETAPSMLVDGTSMALRLVRRGARALLVVGEGGAARTWPVLLPDEPTLGTDGLTRREVVVRGWRFEVELEPERRAALRERARRGREATARGGPTPVKAIIPGRVVVVSVEPGEAITAGQQILVVEAMKMQNELRAPRDGTVQRIAVAPGQTIEVGDLLLVIE
jgi:biotin carboxyl carrier protein